MDCELQYGSDGDYERGDGLRVDHSYPLTCNVVAETSDPLSPKRPSEARPSQNNCVRRH